MNEPSDVTNVSNENDVPIDTKSEATRLLDILSSNSERDEDNTRRIAAAAERIADAIEAYCRLHGAKIAPNIG